MTHNTQTHTHTQQTDTETYMHTHAASTDAHAKKRDGKRQSGEAGSSSARGDIMTNKKQSNIIKKHIKEMKRGGSKKRNG